MRVVARDRAWRDGRGQEISMHLALRWTIRNLLRCTAGRWTSAHSSRQELRACNDRV